MSTPSHRPYFIDDTYSFLTLPPELRNRVYAFLMNDIDAEHEVQSRPFEQVERGKMMVIVGWSVARRSLSSQLLRTCRKVSTEATHVLYKDRAVHTKDVWLHHEALQMLPAAFSSRVEEVTYHDTSNSFDPWNYNQHRVD